MDPGFASFRVCDFLDLDMRMAYLIWKNIQNNRVAAAVSQIRKLSRRALTATVHVTFNGDTILSLAITRGHAQIVDLILDECDVSVNVMISFQLDIDNQLMSGRAHPIWCAAKFHHVQVVKSLLRHGARVNAKSGTNMEPTAIVAACSVGNAKMICALLEAGADLQSYGAYCLFAAGKRVGIVKLLLEKGLVVKDLMRYNPGSSALIDAIGFGTPEIAQLLLKHGANSYSKNEDGEDALSVAARHGFRDMVELILKNRKDWVKDRITAYELLGAASMDRSNAEQAIDYWLHAMLMRHAHPTHSTNYMPANPAYQNSAEPRNMPELLGLIPFYDELIRYGLMLKERILGVANRSTRRSLAYRVDRAALNVAIDLFLYQIQVDVMFGSTQQSKVKKTSNATEQSEEETEEMLLNFVTQLSSLSFMQAVMNEEEMLLGNRLNWWSIAGFTLLESVVLEIQRLTTITHPVTFRDGQSDRERSDAVTDEGVSDSCGENGSDGDCSTMEGNEDEDSKLMKRLASISRNVHQDPARGDITDDDDCYEERNTKRFGFITHGRKKKNAAASDELKLKDGMIDAQNTECQDTSSDKSEHNADEEKTNKQEAEKQQGQKDEKDLEEDDDDSVSSVLKDFKKLLSRNLLSDEFDGAECDVERMKNGQSVGLMTAYMQSLTNQDWLPSRPTSEQLLQRLGNEKNAKDSEQQSAKTASVDQLMHAALYLIKFLNRLELADSQIKMELKQLVRKLLDVRLTDGRTLLLLAVEDDCFELAHVLVLTHPTQPCDPWIHTTSLLLDCGADPDAVNQSGDSALHVCANELPSLQAGPHGDLERRQRDGSAHFDWSCDVISKKMNEMSLLIRGLLEHGAHPDVANNRRVVALNVIGRYMKDVAELYNQSVTLQCLAARQVKDSNIEYKGLHLAHSLVQFIDMH